MRTHKGISRIIVLLVVALIVAVALLVYFIGFQPSSPPQSVKITRFSLDSLNIGEDQNTTMRVDIENINKTRDHQIEYRFNVSQKVLIYTVGGKLLDRVDSCYSHNFTLLTSTPTLPQEFIVTGTIPQDMKSGVYELVFSVYVDGEKLLETWGKMDLTIRKSA